jgi:hypothetical protein
MDLGSTKSKYEPKIESGTRTEMGYIKYFDVIKHRVGNNDLKLRLILRRK